MEEPVVPELGRRPRRSPRRRLKVRGWVFVSGGSAALAMVIAAAVVLNPLVGARDDLRQIAADGVPLQTQIVALRTSVVDWQFFIERHLDDLKPGEATDPAELVKGGQIVATQTAQSATLSRELRRVGFESDARDLDAAMKTFNAALTKLTPVAAGKSIDAASLSRFVGAERAAIERVWTLTTRIGTHVARDITSEETKQASDRLAFGLWLFLIGLGLTLFVVSGAAIVFGRRAGRRDRQQHEVARRHAYESRVQEALEMTKTEPEVYVILGEALSESVPHLQTEMLVADSSRAHFRRELTNGGDFQGCSVVSPLDCPAATAGHALVFPSSRALNACPYLKARPSGECSAVCLPLSIAGRTVGVTHAIGPDGSPPEESDVDSLNYTTRRGAERIAMIRAFATSQTQAQTDPLTGLLNRRSLENAVRDLRDQGIAYSLAYGDLDHFKVLNDTHGHEVGDQALRVFARVLRTALRPNDIAARYGGEEFVVILPDCETNGAASVLERVRESLALDLSAGVVPPFTVTFGVASTAYASDFEQIVSIADHALLDAKAAGRNRVCVARLVDAQPSR
jgi:diguanylate cyclase (GGDEF)-like protein